MTLRARFRQLPFACFAAICDPQWIVLMNKSNKRFWHDVYRSDLVVDGAGFIMKCRWPRDDPRISELHGEALLRIALAKGSKR